MLIVALIASVQPSFPRSAISSAVASRVSPISHTSLAFEPNAGQAPAAVRFIVHGPDYTAYLGTSGVAFVSMPSVTKQLRLNAHGFGLGRHMSQRRLSAVREVRLRFVGTSRTTSLLPEHRLTGRVNYLLGPNPRHWHTDIPTYGAVLYRNVYPGIDLRFVGGRTLEYRWIVHPGAHPSEIAMALSVASTRPVTSSVALRGGRIRVWSGRELLTQSMPHVYQPGAQSPIPARFALSPGHVVHFRIGRYNARRMLIIDPELVYTYFYGNIGDIETFNAIAVDASGAAYVAGGTDGDGFPTTNPFQGTLNGTACQEESNQQVPCEDAVITKLSPDGTNPIYSTYFGGSGTDEANAIAVDMAGDATIAGSTNSADLPLSHPAQSSYGGGTPQAGEVGDAFIARLNNSGDGLVYSTYLGGSEDDEANGVALDSAGNAFITGDTRSDNFPTRNPAQAHRTPGDCAYKSGSADIVAPCRDAFVAKVGTAGQLLYSTYFGGSDEDEGDYIAVDGQENAYVAGITASDDLPITASAFQKTLTGGTIDGLVLKLDPSGSRVDYATYLGDLGGDFGSDFADEPSGIAVDGQGDAIVAGTTTVDDFPVTSGAFQQQGGGGYNGFVVKFSPDGSSLLYGTYLGGSGDQTVGGMAINSVGEAYVVGYTNSADFPLKNDLNSPAPAADEGGNNNDTGFITELTTDGKQAVYSSYLGGTGGGTLDAVAVDKTGAAYVLGQVGSTDYPVAAGGGVDVADAVEVVAKISPAEVLPTPTTVPTATSTAAPTSTPAPAPAKTPTSTKHKKRHRHAACKLGYHRVKGKCRKKR